MSYIGETIHNLRYSGPLALLAASSFVCFLLASLLLVLRKPWNTAVTMLSIGLALLIGALLNKAIYWFSIGRSPVEGHAEGWMVNQAMGLFLQQLDVLLLILTVNSFLVGIFAAVAIWFRASASTRFLLFGAVLSYVLCVAFELIRFRIRVLIAL